MAGILSSFLNQFSNGFSNSMMGLNSGSTDLRFPLENQNDYVGRITFTAKKEQYRTLQGTGLEIFNNTKAQAQGVTGATAPSSALAKNESIRAVAENANSNIGYNAGQIDPGLAAAAGTARSKALDAFGGEGATVIQGIGIDQTPGANYKKPSGTVTISGSANDIETMNQFKAVNTALTTVSTPTPTYQVQGAVQLYLPSTLQFSDQIEYANVDLGVKGTVAAKALQAGGGIVGAAMEGIKKMFDLEGVVDMVTKGLSSDAAQVLAMRMASVSPEIQGAVETETGISLNPNRRSTLRGVGVRRFRFTFKLLPTSPEEAKQITKIIEFFRREMYPQTGMGDLALNFPSKWDIQMTWGGKRVATKILPCFLEFVDVVYNPNSMAFHDDGEFQETDITLAFVEERALTKKDIGDGY